MGQSGLIMYQRISAPRPVQPDNAAIAKINVYISLVMRYAEIKWLQEVASDFAVDAGVGIQHLLSDTNPKPLPVTI